MDLKFGMSFRYSEGHCPTHRMQSGGHMYVCGDAQHMAGDVHAVLKDLIGENGKMDLESAEKFLQNLETTKRYQKDTWF